jgi:hypothetical protein
VRKSLAIVAVAGSAALVLASASTSLAQNGSNAGHAGSASNVHVTPQHLTTNAKTFKAIAKPTKAYTKATCDIDLSGITDGTVVSSVTGCGTTIKISTPNYKASVPNGGWGSWGSPPNTETATPNVLWTQGAFAETISLGKKSSEGGMEIEPDAFQIDDITVQFFSKGNGKGKLVGTVERDDADGSSGAKLFAATSSKGSWKSVVITDNGSDDFAVAQIRL